MRLHPLYGIPYIPASAIKGSLRNALIQKLFANEKEAQTETPEEVALKNEQFLTLFGDQTHQGELIFFDAFISSDQTPKLKLDVMTPHYKKYYTTDSTAPDTQSPVPITFLTLEETTFEFFYAIREELKDIKLKGKSLKELFKEAFANYGIGAKTSVGYGYLETTNS